MKNNLLLLAFLLLSFQVFAQDIPVKRLDRNTFSFSTKDLVLIKDFSIEGPSYHITDDPYQFTIQALTENGETDKAVSGNFTFSLNGEIKEINFKDGQALAEKNLGKSDVLKVQLANTNLEKTITISRFSGTPAYVGLLVFLLLTFLFRHQLARMFRRLFVPGKK